MNRRTWMQLAGTGLASFPFAALATEPRQPPLKITDLVVIPVALPDPPLLAASGCHGPYFLRNIVQLNTDAGLVGIGETRGGEEVRMGLLRVRKALQGQNAFAHRALAPLFDKLDPACFAAVELACLDACGKATGRRLCELLGGPVRDEVEFAAYLFYRFAADHPVLLDDKRNVDGRGKGDKALDDWGEVRSPEAMVKTAERFRRQWGFRVFKLKGGVLPPKVELETLKQMNAHFEGKHPLRIDPNGRWTKKTAVAIGKAMDSLPLEYYEDPVEGQPAMARVRRATGLTMSTNSCVTRFHHLPQALRLRPVDVILCDLHWWGGITGCQALGRLCKAGDWQLSQHSNNHAGITMAAMVHLAASVPQVTLASDTHYPWLIEGGDIIQGPNLRIRDGKLPVPDGPGVGVVLDPDRLARAHETWQKSGMRERDDGGTMRKIEPDYRRERKW